ncbi:DMT family transporter [Mesorhizobium liriopis]|uniref:DMT family transporter n=1 Tax=Mesorhizobium liriopis TaxID=2953882 RepID=UPI00338DE8DF
MLFQRDLSALTHISSSSAQTEAIPPVASRNDATLGIVSLVAGIAVFSAQDVIIKLLSDTYPVHQAMTIRSLVALPLLLALVAVTGGVSTLVSKSAPLLAARGAIMFVSYTSYYLAFAALPLATCVAIFFVAPLFITILSAFFLRESVDAPRWVAVLMGFLGVLVIIRPGTVVFDAATLLPVLAALTYAVSQTLARKLGETNSAAVMTFYGNGVYLLAGIVLAMAFGGSGSTEGMHKSLSFLMRSWSDPSVRDLLLMAACGVIAAVGLTLLSQAYRSTRASTVAPFEYVAILLSIAYGWFIWGEWPDFIAWAGIAIVISSGLYVMARERGGQAS